MSLRFHMDYQTLSYWVWRRIHICWCTAIISTWCNGWNHNEALLNCLRKLY